MWKSVKIKEPMIIDSKDWKMDEFSVICKLFHLLPNKTNQIILRENYSYEYDSKN